MGLLISLRISYARMMMTNLMIFMRNSHLIPCPLLQKGKAQKRECAQEEKPEKYTAQELK